MAYDAGRVLFVDDDESITRIFPALLEVHGYKVTASVSSVDALALFQRSPWSFDVVVTDYVMAEMSGEALIRVLRQVRPELPIILCSGSYDAEREDPEHTLGIHAFLRKPLACEDLIRSIQQALNPPQEWAVEVTPS